MKNRQFIQSVCNRLNRIFQSVDQAFEFQKFSVQKPEVHLIISFEIQTLNFKKIELATDCLKSVIEGWVMLLVQYQW